MFDIKKIVFFFLCASMFKADALLIGQWPHMHKENNRIDHTTIPFYSNAHNYVQGGITFLYPEEYFSSEPYVYVTLELNGLKYSADLQLSPIVVRNSPTSVTVYVNKETSGLFSKSTSEAANNDVIVHLFAFGS